ncbi:MAG TPA: hypothetical protein VE152_11955, partial [Acidimicrobiales bacterium]|nr:hypothetical protein [Acidimicrobiales bacterium]
PEAAAAAGVAQLRAEHAGASDGDLVAVRTRGVAGEVMARAAAASGDPHQVKLVEACRRGGALLADPAFPAAAEAVTGLGLVGEGGPDEG